MEFFLVKSVTLNCHKTSLNHHETLSQNMRWIPIKISWIAIKFSWIAIKPRWIAKPLSTALTCAKLSLNLAELPLNYAELPWNAELCFIFSLLVPVSFPSYFKTRLISILINISSIFYLHLLILHPACRFQLININYFCQN